MNIPLLRQVKRAILAEPRRLTMNNWIMRDCNSPCGTVACIAGHVALIDALKKNKKTLKNKAFIKTVDISPIWNSAIDDAPRLLGLTRVECLRLFFIDGWPKEFGDEYDNLPRGLELIERQKLRAKITARRIEHFIKTGL